MDLLHYPFAFDGEDRPHAFIADAGIHQKLRLYRAHLRARRPAQRLVLIGLPGTGKTILSDRIIRIEAAEFPAVGRHQASSWFDRFTKTAHHTARKLKSLVELRNKRKPDFGANADWCLLSNELEFVTCSEAEIYSNDLPVLNASADLRKWVTAD